MKVDGEILAVQIKMRESNSLALQARLAELLKKRQTILSEMETQAKARIK